MDQSHAALRHRLAVAAVVGIGAILIAIVRRDPTASAGVLLLLATAPVALVWVVRRDRRETFLWASYMAAFLLFAALRAHADGFFEARSEYVILLDRTLFSGTIPTLWLQERLYTPGSPTWFDWFMAAVHVSYFIVPHALGLFVWAYRPRFLAHYLVAMIATYYVALGIQALVPTVPPWMAGLGEGHGHAYRLVEEILAPQTPEAYDQVYAVAGANDVAAMPSLHTAVTVLVALVMTRLGRGSAWLGWSYAALMAFALVYTGEHYVVDTLAGAALAFPVWYGTEQCLARKSHHSSSQAK